MPAVVGFIAGIGAAAASVVGIGLIGIPAIAVGSAVLALTVAAARRAAKLDDPSDAGYATGQQVSVRSTEAPRNIAYGEVNVGGVFTYVNSAGTELRSLYYELVHVGHEIDSFIGWYLDDKYIPVADVDVAGDGSVDTNTGGHGLDDISGTPVLYLRGHLGTSGQAVDSMLDTAFTDIGANHRHRGCAKSVIRCELVSGYESRWNGRPPASITAVFRGMKVYDPRADGTFAGGVGAQRLATPSTWVWSDNPALIWANYRTLAKPLGPAWDTGRIDWQSVFDAANACDVAAAIPTATTEKRFRCDLVVNTSMEPEEVVEQILATMAGSERQFNGDWHVYAGVWPTPDFALDESDLVGPIQYRKQPETASQDRYNQIKGEYFDRARQWKLSPFVTVNETSLRASRDNNRTLTKHLRLEGVSREYQAQRLAIRALRQCDDTGILVFLAGYSAANIRFGDTGTVSIAELGWVNKSFRCVGVKGIDFVGYELRLKEDASGNYTDPIEAEYSTRTAAGTIAFGTVMPWYLFGSSATGWAGGSNGKPAGVRGVESITDRSQLSLVDAWMRITSSPDAAVGYGLPAIPINYGTRYTVRVKHRASAASADGLYIRMNEYAGSLGAGKTHVGLAAGAEAVVQNRTSTVDLIADGPMVTAAQIQEFTYTPTAGTTFASLSFYNFNPATAAVYIEIAWAALTEVGTNVDLLPGVRPPGDTADLNPESATSVYTLTDSDQMNMPDIFVGPVYTLEFPIDITEEFDCVVYATFTANIEAPNGAGISVQGYVNGSGVSGASNAFTVPVTTGQRVSMQFQLDVSAGDAWNVELTAFSYGGVATADLTDIRWEVNVIRR